MMDPFEDKYVVCNADATIQMLQLTASGSTYQQTVLHTSNLLKSRKSIVNCKYNSVENTLAVAHPAGIVVLQIDWDENTMAVLN